MQLTDIFESYNREDWTSKLLLQNDESFKLDLTPENELYAQNRTKKLLKAIETEYSVLLLQDYVSNLEKEIELTDSVLRYYLNPHQDKIINWLEQKFKTNNSPAARRHIMLIVSQIILLLSIGIKWPKLIELLNNNKDSILTYFIDKIESAFEDPIDLDILHNDIELLLKFVNWAELHTIEKGLNKFVDESVFESENTDGRKLIIDMLLKKLEYARGIFYLLHDLEYYNFKLKDWPELNKVINAHQDILMKSILENLLGNDINDVNTAKFLLDRLRTVGVDWSELDIVEKAINKELERYRAINEDSNLTNAKIERIIKSFKSKANTDIYSIIYFIRELQQSGINDSDLKTVLRQEMPFISHKLQNVKDLRWLNVKFRAIEELQNILGSMPEFHTILENIKSEIEEGIMYSLERSLFREAVNIMKSLQNLKIDKAYIQKLREIIKNFAITQLKETVTQKGFYHKNLRDLVELLDSINVKVNLGSKFVANIIANFANYVEHFDQFFDSGETHNFISSLLKFNNSEIKKELINIIDNNKIKFIKEILHYIDRVGGYSNDAMKLTTMLKGLGFKWPELATIETGLMKLLRS